MQYFVSIKKRWLDRGVRVGLYLTGSSLFFLVSCSEPPPLKLTLQQRDMVDTIYLQKIQTLGPRLDSICQASREQQLKKAVDSILATRRTEEDKLRAKYHLNK